MGRSVSHPGHTAWVLYTAFEAEMQEYFVCTQCGLDAEPDSTPDVCERCGGTEFSLCPPHQDELQWQWNDFVEGIAYAFKTAFPSLSDCDKWLDHEGRAILENTHAWIGVSEYSGAVCIWCVPKTAETEHRWDEPTDAMHRRWAESIEAKAESTLNGVSPVLTRVGTLSNGESVYRRKNVVNNTKAAA